MLVFEDLHWADDGLLDFVDDLVDWVGDVPLLVAGTARPELLERRQAWGGGKPNATTISLQPLAEEDTARLISALLPRPLQPPTSDRRCSSGPAGTRSSRSSTCACCRSAARRPSCRSPCRA